MNAKLRLIACAVLLGPAFLIAEPAKTKVLVLDNENLLEGEVTKVETGYQVRRPVGGDLTLPASRVLAVVADRRAAFAIVAERANLRDADERLRLARWCQLHDLPTEALFEARAAARMRPGFSEAERFVLTLELAAKAQPTPGVRPAKAEETSSAPAPVADIKNLEYNTASFPLFSSKVNAILVNTCSNCHATADAKGFRLTAAGGRSAVSQNLMAALPYIDPADPTKSLILTKTLTAHGSATDAPIRSRTHPAYLALESWVKIAREGTSKPIEPGRLPALGPAVPVLKGDAFGQDSQSSPPVVAKPTSVDPFDPAGFNAAKPKKK